MIKCINIYITNTHFKHNILCFFYDDVLYIILHIVLELIKELLRFVWLQMKMKYDIHVKNMLVSILK